MVGILRIYNQSFEMRGTEAINKNSSVLPLRGYNQIEYNIIGDIEFAMESTLNQMSNPFEDELPPGFRFHPTDEELVTYYLTNKLLDSTFSSCAVAETDLNKCEPWDLPAKAKIGEKEWYFFGLRDRKYPRGVRTNRATEAGYWKTTGKKREVFSSRSSAPVGMKRTLVFYKGRAPKAEKTKWVMHEYRVQGKLSCHSLPSNCKTEWVVCRIYKKRAVVKRSSVGPMSSHAYIDLPGSPSFPSLFYSPRNTAAGNDQKTRSSERQAGTSTNVHDESCFSIPMEPKAHYLHQIQSGSNANYHYSSDQVSELYRIKEDSPYMHNLMVNDRRINMNEIPRNALFSVSNIRGDQISAKLDQQPGIQQLPAIRKWNLRAPLQGNNLYELPSKELAMGSARRYCTVKSSGFLTRHQR